MAPELKEGERGLVYTQSWAGVTSATVEILKVCPKRYKVKWLAAAIGHYAGHESYVPHYAVHAEH